ncbi:MAG: efflux RND transporter periplasmic adaptor subunit [Hyphomicrobiaceae bacterium]
MVLDLNSLRRGAVGRGLFACAAAVPLAVLLPNAVPMVRVTQGGNTLSAGVPGQIGAKTWFVSAHAETSPAKGKVRYTCPMHPHYISDHAGTCPICGMELVKMQAASDAGGGASESRQVVSIAPEVVQNMGVRIAPAENVKFGRTVRATAIVSENERARSVMTARVEGWIEGLKVTAVGDPVKKGMKLYELFAPELVVSQRDYLIARRERDRNRIEATETRLRAFGVQDQAMRQLTESGREMQKLPFYADRDGVIAELPVVDGEYLKRGASVLRIQDYRSVWLIVNVAEKDLGFISTRTPANVSFPSMPGRTFATRVDYVYPTIDAKTRTGRARLIVENKDGAIRPGSFADVSFEVSEKPRLAVRSEAVLTGERGSYVVIALGKGRFEPRLVETGLISDGWTEVRKGVVAGDQVVVSGQFLIDSESALGESFRKLERLQTPLPLLELSKGELAMVDHYVDAAIYLHEVLVDGYDVDPKFLQPAREIKSLLWPKFGQTRLAVVIDDATMALEQAQAARSESQSKAALANLVEAIRPWMETGAPQHYADKDVGFFREDGSGRQWIQRGTHAVNPFGKAAATRVPWKSGSTEKKAPEAAPKEQPVIVPGHGAHAQPLPANGG